MIATSVRSPGLPVATLPLSRWSSHEHIFHEGDPASAIYVIESGAVIIYRTALDGCRLIHGIRFRGELVGLGFLDSYSVSAIASSPTAARTICRCALERMIETDPAVARTMMQALMAEMQMTSDQLMVIGSRTALGRLAACLLDLSNRAAGGGDTFVLPVSRAEMGDLLGLTIETVSRSFSRLRALDMIALPKSDTVVIRNRPGLMALAQDEGEGAARGRLCA